MFPVKDRYDEVFEIEINGWCFAITNFPGEISPELMHYIIRELAIGFHAAIEHNVVFSVADIASKLQQAARYLVHEKELAYSIVAQLPNPNVLDDEPRSVLDMILDKAESGYPGITDAFYDRWQMALRGG